MSRWSLPSNAVSERSVFGDPAETEPVSVDLNVDAALALQRMVGIDSYPAVLAIMPNVYDIDDADRVHAVVVEQLVEAGLVENDCVHPTLETWLRCLYRPDVELAVRIVDNGSAGHDPTMLRMSLVRCGELHILAVRCDDHIVVQQVFAVGRSLDALVAAVKAALGECPPLALEPLAASVEALEQVSGDPDERRLALCELGARPHTASVLTRALGEVVRRAELVMIEHQDGGIESVEPKAAVSVLDTMSGRLVVTPSAALDGRLWSTFRPGDDAALKASIDALIELLPGRSWFDTSRES